MMKLLGKAVSTVEKYKDRPPMEIISALGRVPLTKLQAEVIAEEVRRFHKITKAQIVPELCKASPEQSQQAAEEKQAPGKKPAVTLPGGSHSITETGKRLGELLANTGHYFIRSGTLVRLKKNQSGDCSLEFIQSAEAASLFEQVAILQKKRDGVLVSTICTESQAKLIINCHGFKSSLPEIILLSSCPVIVEVEGKLRIINGYDQTTGILANGTIVQEVPLEKAIKLLKFLFDDFNFSTPADGSRAMAALITPALLHGGLLPGRAPVDLGEADKSQTGKGYRNKLAAAIYRIKSRMITQKKGGTGSLEESISAALIRGASFICLDNVRGKIDSPALESLLTEDRFSARMPYRADVEIDPRRVFIQMTSNRAELTKDLANRSCCVRLLKQPDGYRFRQFPDGDILDLVRNNQPHYLGAVFAIIKEWHKRGKPKTNETRHDFRLWAQTLDWIITNIFEMPRMLDGHRETQARMTNPAMSWLREVALLVMQKDQTGEWLRVNQIVELLDDSDVSLPGLKKGEMLDDDNLKSVWQQTGRKLGKCFLSGGDSIDIDNILIKRDEKFDPNKGRSAKIYRFSRVD